MSPRLATFVMFLVNGVVIGIWIAAIPGVKDGLGASGGDFGMALLFGPIGALVAQQVTGQLLVRVSSRRLLTVAALIFPWLVVLPIIAPSLPLLAASLFVFGYVNTTMDVSMNAHGIALEDQASTSIMSGLHGGWSLGGIFGAVGIAASLFLGLEPRLAAAITAVAMVLVVVWTARHLGIGSVRTEGVSGLHLPTRAVLPLAVVVALIAFVEGGLTDWGGVYLDLGVGAGESLAAMAYAALSLGLFVGRMGGDWAKDRIGSIRLTQWGMFLTGAAIALFLVFENPWVALFGMAVAGLGLANTIPQIFGAAGRIPPGGPSLSAVFTALTLTFVLSPLIIGNASDAVGISGAFWMLVVVSIVVGLIVSRVKSAETNPRFRHTS